jgi:hypothetical protein
VRRRARFAPLYSITSSAHSIIDRGTVRPGAFAVLRFTTISNFCRKLHRAFRATADMIGVSISQLNMIDEPRTNY